MPTAAVYNTLKFFNSSKRHYNLAASGRAIRSYLFAQRQQKGYPLLSLTQGSVTMLALILKGSFYLHFIHGKIISIVEKHFAPLELLLCFIVYFFY